MKQKEIKKRIKEKAENSANIIIDAIINTEGEND